MRLLLAIMCVIPSAWVNTKAQLAVGAGYDIVSGVILFAFLGPIFTMVSVEAFRSGKRITGFAWALLASVFITMNAIIALSGISGVRDAAMDARADIQRRDAKTTAQIKEITDRITDLRKTAGSATVGMLQAEIDGYMGDRLYKRSIQCTDRSVDDSRAHCGKLDQAKGRIEAAKAIANWEAVMAQKGWNVGTATEPVPTSIDPGISNIIALVVAIFNVKLDERFLAALLSGSLALLLELAADLGPVGCMTLLRKDTPVVAPEASTSNPPALEMAQTLQEGLRPPGALRQALANPPAQIFPPLRQPSSRADASPPVDGLTKPSSNPPAKPSRGAKIRPEAAIPPDHKAAGYAGEEDLKRWAAECIIPKAEHNLQAKPLYEQYVIWAEARGIAPVTPVIFGKLMPTLGFPKQKLGGFIVYLDIALKAPALKIVRELNPNITVTPRG